MATENCERKYWFEKKKIYILLLLFQLEQWIASGYYHLFTIPFSIFLFS